MGPLKNHHRCSGACGPSDTWVSRTVLTINGQRVPTFTKDAFTNATVNGDYLGFDGPTKVNTLNGGDLVLKTGQLTTTCAGSSFAVKFKAAK